MYKKTDIADWPETKCRLVDAGVLLMRTRGFNATSLDDVCEAVSVTKGGFFHYFKSKEELAKAAMLRFAADRAQAFKGAPFQRLANPVDRIFGRLDYLENFFKSGKMTHGCLIGTLSQELAFTHPQLRGDCRELLAGMARGFENDLSEAIKTQKPTRVLNPASLAKYYVALFQGSMIQAKVEGNNAVILENLAQFRQHLQFLFQPEEAPGTARQRKSNA